MTVLAACGGGGGGEPVRAVTTVTVSSPTSTPKQGDTVQLTAVARDQFGDVFPGKPATWSTSDAQVATISSTGLLQAVAPGTVATTATIDGVSGSLTLTVLAAPTWATVVQYDKTYRMDYELDGERRVRSYELRDLTSGRLVRWCTGDLHGSWQCRYEEYAPYASSSAIFDAQRRPVEYRRNSQMGGEYTTYAFDAAERLAGFGRQQYTESGNIITSSGTLEYDAGGRLAVIRVRVINPRNGLEQFDRTYTVVSSGDVPTQFLATSKNIWTGLPMPPELTIRLEHDSAGRYLRRTVSEVTADSERTRSDRQWSIDSRGYLTSWLSRYYDVTPPPAEEQWGWCLEWSASAPTELASERRCAPPAASGSLVYAYGRMPSVPLTVFRPYAASSALDVLCAAADVCIDPARLYLTPF